MYFLLEGDHNSTKPLNELPLSQPLDYFILLMILVAALLCYWMTLCYRT